MALEHCNNQIVFNKIFFPACFQNCFSENEEMTYCLTKFLFTQCSLKQKSFNLLLCSTWAPVSLGSRPCFADLVQYLIILLWRC